MTRAHAKSVGRACPGTATTAKARHPKQAPTVVIPGQCAGGAVSKNRHDVKRVDRKKLFDVSDAEVGGSQIARNVSKGHGAARSANDGQQLCAWSARTDSSISKSSRMPGMSLLFASRTSLRLWP